MFGHSWMKRKGWACFNIDMDVGTHSGTDFLPILHSFYNHINLIFSAKAKLLTGQALALNPSLSLSLFFFFYHLSMVLIFHLALSKCWWGDKWKTVTIAVDFYGELEAHVLRNDGNGFDWERLRQWGSVAPTMGWGQPLPLSNLWGGPQYWGTEMIFITMRTNWGLMKLLMELYCKGGWKNLTWWG